jgi:predicted phosphohydrolase
MNVWAISDLHLSLARPDRPARTTARWRDHVATIEQNWREVVRAGDLVLLPGDLSMARNHRDVQPDLEWLARLPGTKVLGPGNHDRWWNRVSAVRRLLRTSMAAVDGDAVAVNGVVVCGTLGAPPAPAEPGAAETAAIDREVERLRNALARAAAIRAGSPQPLFVLRHFPPFDAHGRPGPWVEQFEHAQVTACVYGHLHSPSEWSIAAHGTIRGVRYHCVAADWIGFRPLRIDTV